ncbi:MAG: glycosyltransferase family 2 protein, partial [Planctomycetota bacterium]|nr:glycosyltransferase family 2 protein [Planctomycetota bacterium]
FLIILKIATFFSPFRVFFPLSLLSFLIGFGYYVYTYITQHRFTNMAMLLIVQSVMLFALALISEQIAQLRFDRSERRGTS